MRHNRAFSELLAFLHEIAFEYDDVLGKRNEMLFLSAGVRIFQNQTAFAAHGSAQFDNAVDFGDFSGILRATSFEQFRNPRQTARNVFCLCDFAWRFRKQRACPHFLAFLDDNVSASGN